MRIKIQHLLLPFLVALSHLGFSQFPDEHYRLFKKLPYQLSEAWEPLYVDFDSTHFELKIPVVECLLFHEKFEGEPLQLSILIANREHENLMRQTDWSSGIHRQKADYLLTKSYVIALIQYDFSEQELYDEDGNLMMSYESTIEDSIRTPYQEMTSEAISELRAYFEENLDSF